MNNLLARLWANCMKSIELGHQEPISPSCRDTCQQLISMEKVNKANECLLWKNYQI